MSWNITTGDALTELRTMPGESVQCCVTSPPYWGLRDYKVAGQLGLEKTPELYVAQMVEVFRQVRRVLRKDGTLFLNMGDSYASKPFYDGDSFDPKWKQARNRARHCGPNRQPLEGFKAKDLIGMPWRLALALQADGWYLRCDIIWNKPNPMPESVTDRPTKSHEYIFLLTKSERYFYDAEAIKEPCLDPADDVRRITQATLDGKSTPTAERNGIRRRGSNSHARGSGVNPKALSWQQHGRIGEERDPRHTKKTGRNSRQCVGRDPTHLKAKRPKQNESFSGAVNQLVTSRNKRSVWNMAVAPFPGAHFATFPVELPEICIKAGTSERGCCPQCGMPWGRITESVPAGGMQKLPAGMATYEGGHGSIHRDGRESAPTYSELYETKTVGWRPSCDCIDEGESLNHGVRVQPEAIPCVVLDPFTGAGTTGLVATRLGRSFRGIELHPNYVAMARQRIIGDAPLFNS